MTTFTEAADLMSRARNPYKRLGNNTWLEYAGAGSYQIRYHSTSIVKIHPDGTYTLDTGGWNTTTTKERINGYSPARVFSEHGTWAIWTKTDPKTAPDIKSCRKCRGTGHVHRDASWSYYADNWRPVFPPKIVMPAYWAKCFNCDGTGQRDYGSKPMPVIFYDGIRVDANGSVIGAGKLPRLNEPAEITTARREAEYAAAVKAQRGLRQAWITEHKVRTGPGVVYLYKAVRDDLVSANGTKYVPGLTVTAKDYQATVVCGAGLHFSPTVSDTLRYDSGATRYLLCAVDRKTLIILDEYQIAPKAKARSCRVIAEVTASGKPIPA
jgi:hypothetical protein